MKGSPTKVVDAEGREYPSMNAAAKALGCTPNAVKYAMQKGRVLCKREREHAWGTTSRLARERGLETQTVHNRIARGCSLEEALSLPQWAELPQIAARVGPKSRLIREAVASGMSLERALLEMPLRDRRVA